MRGEWSDERFLVFFSGSRLDLSHTERGTRELRSQTRNGDDGWYAGGTSLGSRPGYRRNKDHSPGARRVSSAAGRRRCRVCGGRRPLPPATSASAVLLPVQPAVGSHRPLFRRPSARAASPRRRGRCARARAARRTSSRRGVLRSWRPGDGRRVRRRRRLETRVHDELRAAADFSSAAGGRRGAARPQAAAIG